MTLDELKEKHFADDMHDNGWFIGNLTWHGNEPWIVGNLNETDVEYIVHDFWVKVFPGTVGQYTGLTDKNGTEIYEGDVLDGSYNLPMTEQLIKKRYVVAKEKGCYIARAKKHPYGSTALSMIHADATIIGNIYENPELLDNASN